MIGDRFSAAAETYDRHARPQLALAQSVIAALPELYPEQILELGPGTGQLTRLLVERFPDVPIDAVDIAGKMVERSRKQFDRFPQVSWIQGDAQIWRGLSPYPLIVSSSALHWVDDLCATCRNAFENLEPGGLFALGMMLEGTLKELHEMRLAVAPDKAPQRLLPSFNRLVEALEDAGFHIVRKKLSEEEIIYDDAATFLRAIHEQGVTGGKVSVGSAPLSRKEINQLIEDYQEAYATPDGVKATYETATLLAVRR
jgi:malonyl-CoA O-methyltransferase